MSWARGIASALALGITIYSGAASADFISVNPTDDRGIVDQNGDGVADGFSSLPAAFLYLGRSSTTSWRGAMEFDLSGISANAVIVNALLSVTVCCSGTTGIVDIWGYAGDGTITIEDGNRTSNLLFEHSAFSTNGYRTVDLSVTDFIQDLVDGGDAWAGFLFGTPDVTRSFGPQLCSLEASSCSKPTLYVEYRVPDPTPNPTTEVPEPASAFVLLGGLFGLTAMRRMRLAAQQ